MRAWGLPVVRRTVAAVAETLDVAGLDLEAALAMRGPVRDLIEAFWMRPGRAEARAWGAFPVEIGEGHGSRAVALAEPYRTGDLVPLLLGRGRMRRHLYFWTEGALAMTPAPLAATYRRWGVPGAGDGDHQWRRGIDDRRVRARLANPFPHVYTCGESYSDDQAWVNGALRSVDQMLAAHFGMTSA